MGREARIHNKLTRKQNNFVKGILSGKTPTQSVMAAYDVEDSKTASVIASQNLNKLSIRGVLDEAFRSNGLTLSLVTSNLGALANSKPENVSGDVKLKANVELLKLMGAYPGSKSVQVSYSIKDQIGSMSYQEIKHELDKINKEVEELLKGTPIPT